MKRVLKRNTKPGEPLSVVVYRCRFSVWPSRDVKMKLGEKIVSYYESCQSPIDKEGYLYKKVRHLGWYFIQNL